ncbi:DUF6680 family protein [Halotia wernerae UHCC 0503]|nr:DUF6680 family protein [Halotia wernerae UHCC 0503]
MSTSEWVLIAQKVDWAVVLATFLGPIIAVLITRWRDNKSMEKGRQIHVFRTLMATRRQKINTDHVAALNLIEIEFYNINSVQEAWRAYLKHLTVADPGRELSQEEFQAREATRQDLITKLLFEMAKYLGFSNLEQIEIRNGGYAPEGWRYRDLQAGRAQDYLIAMSEGRATLPVRVVPPA